MVHETCVIIAREVWNAEQDDLAYLWIQFVDLFDGRLNVSIVDRIPDVHPLLYRFDIGRWLDVCFSCELVRSRWVSFVDQIVHDDQIDVPI